MKADLRRRSLQSVGMSSSTPISARQTDRREPVSYGVAELLVISLFPHILPIAASENHPDQTALAPAREGEPPQPRVYIEGVVLYGCADAEELGHLIIEVGVVISADEQGLANAVAVTAAGRPVCE